MNATRKVAVKRPTLGEIAADAGVSISTVSKVLNGRPGVSAPTRLRIEELLHQSDYSPRRDASGAAVIEVVYTMLDNEWILEVLRGVEKVADEDGASIILTRAQALRDPEHSWIDSVIRRRTEGVILLFSSLSPLQKRQLRSRSIAFAVVDPAGEPEPDVPYVGSQNWAGGFAAAEHLIEQGHRRIALITGSPDRRFSQARRSGALSALEAAGIEIPAHYIRSSDFLVSSGYKEAKALFGLPTPPTAIMAATDQLAMGVYEAARDAGMAIPGDLSVVGYDDLPMAQWAGPPLTTIRQPIREMAETAARIVTGAAEQNSRIDLAVSLVVRESTAAPRDRR